MWNKPLTLLGASAVTLLLAACSGAEGDDDRPRVIASSYPFAFVAERVGGGHIQVDNLTQPGGEPHDVELTPQQVADLTKAELVVYERGFQPAVDDGIDQAELPDDAVLDVAEVVELRPLGDEGHAEDEPAHEEHAEGEHDHDDGTDHDHGSLDPHVWLDPTRMVTITRTVADRMATIDSDHARDYRRQADALVGELRQLDAAYRQGLASCARDTIVTSHDAFGYLTERYGLEQIPIAGIDPHNEPSPDDQARIADLVRDHGVTTVFTETLVSDDVAQSIADETGVTVATLDPIGGLSDDTSDETYLTLMRSNLKALRQANDCS